MLIAAEGQYFRTAFRNEGELKSVVRQQAVFLFGENILFLPKTKITTLDGVGAISDGFIVDVRNERWYLVEAELAHHGVWQHIAPQVAKQVVAMDNREAREKLLHIRLELIKTDAAAAEIFQELDIAPMAIGRLKKILSQPPIDAVPEDLCSCSGTLRFAVKIWLIEKYRRLDGDEVIYALPEENRPTFSSTASASIDPGSEDDETANGARTTQLWQNVLQADLLQTGQSLLLSYGPQDQPEATFRGLVREDGIKIDGRIMSPSTAALYCMRQAGSPRHLANGWAMWRTEEGVLLDELYRWLPRQASPVAAGSSCGSGLARDLSGRPCCEGCNRGQARFHV